MASSQNDRLEIALVEGIIKAIGDKDYKAVDVLSSQVDKLRFSGKKPPGNLHTVKQAAIMLGLSYTGMRHLANSVPMRGAVYNANPAGKYKSLRIDVDAARKVLRAWPAGYYK